jgi:hypothetical protein
VRTLVNDEAWVHYGQIYVRSGDDFAELEECFTGQANGLTARPGWTASPANATGRST